MSHAQLCVREGRLSQRRRSSRGIYLLLFVSLTRSLLTFARYLLHAFSISRMVSFSLIVSQFNSPSDSFSHSLARCLSHALSLSFVVSPPASHRHCLSHSSPLSLVVSLIGMIHSLPPSLPSSLTLSFTSPPQAISLTHTLKRSLPLTHSYSFLSFSLTNSSVCSLILLLLLSLVLSVFLSLSIHIYMCI